MFDAGGDSHVSLSLRVCVGLFYNRGIYIWISWKVSEWYFPKTSSFKHPWEPRRNKRRLEVLWNHNASGTHELYVYFSVLTAYAFIKHLFLSWQSTLFEANYLEVALQNQAFIFIVKVSSYLWLTNFIYFTRSRRANEILKSLYNILIRSIKRPFEIMEFLLWTLPLKKLFLSLLCSFNETKHWSYKKFEKVIQRRYSFFLHPPPTACVYCSE